MPGLRAEIRGVQTSARISDLDLRLGHHSLLPLGGANDGSVDAFASFA
jgi:hypothetical protein